MPEAHPVVADDSDLLHGSIAFLPLRLRWLPFAFPFLGMAGINEEPDTLFPVTVDVARAVFFTASTVAERFIFRPVDTIEPPHGQSLPLYSIMIRLSASFHARLLRFIVFPPNVL